MAVSKSKAKEWYTIVAPKMFGGKEIGKTPASDQKKLIGRRLIVSPIELTENFGKYYVKLAFKITDVNGNKVYTSFDGSECMRDYISRMILRRVRRVDTVQDLVTKDSLKIRVKSLAIISRRVKSSIKKRVRERMRELVKDSVEKMSLEEFMEKVLSDELKNRILRELRMIYPVRNFEFRKTEMLK